MKATLDDEGFYNKESILNLILNTEALSYEYVLAVLNSRLTNWFYKRRFTNSSKLTVNLSKELCKPDSDEDSSKSRSKEVEHLVDG